MIPLPRRPDRGSAGREIHLVSNLFKLDFTDMFWYKFDVEIMTATEAKVGEPPSSGSHIPISTFRSTYSFCVEFSGLLCRAKANVYAELPVGASDGGGYKAQRQDPVETVQQRHHRRTLQEARA